MSRWQGIASAPRDGTRFDVWVPSCTGGYRVADLFFNNRGSLCKAGIGVKDLARWPTHWMPLPDAPTTPSTEGQGE